MRILVVEDDTKIANALKKGLEQETYAVDVAYDGESGLDLGLTETYDVIILDWMLPVVDGYSVCLEMRKHGILTPVMFLTAKDKVDEKVEGLNVGADDYLTKPFAFEELVARIQALLRRPKELHGEELIVGSITLNTKLRLVKNGSSELNLTSKEYALLEYLIRNKGRVVSKDELMQHVWDYSADILPNTVEALIGSLRNKIDAASSSSSVIQTIRGHGYKIE